MGRYAWYVLTSHPVVALTGAVATGTSGSMKNLSQEVYLGIAGAAPPIAEQREIVNFLDRETAEIDGMVIKVETAIQRLQEYRTALITAAVTGRVDVRGAVA
jgi:type I restriction enzyme S subunit